jgi:hypothetical protein
MPIFSFGKKIIIGAQSAWLIKPGQVHKNHSIPTIAFTQETILVARLARWAQLRSRLPFRSVFASLVLDSRRDVIHVTRSSGLLGWA